MSSSVLYVLGILTLVALCTGLVFAAVLFVMRRGTGSVGPERSPDDPEETRARSEAEIRAKRAQRERDRREERTLELLEQIATHLATANLLRDAPHVEEVEPRPARRVHPPTAPVQAFAPPAAPRVGASEETPHPAPRRVPRGVDDAKTPPSPPPFLGGSRRNAPS